MQTRITTTAVLLITLSLLLALPSASMAATPRTPVEVVEDLHAALLDAMKRAVELGYQGRYDLLEPAIHDNFDQKFMAQKSIGIEWKKLSEEDQQRWLDSFARLTVANYAGRFRGYSGEEFKTLGHEPAPRDTMMVQTVIILPSDDDIQLNYRLLETPDGWRIIDVYMNGTVSELALRRAEYASTLKRKGFEELAAAVDQKVIDLAETGATSAKLDSDDLKN